MRIKFHLYSFFAVPIALQTIRKPRWFPLKQQRWRHEDAILFPKGSEIKISITGQYLPLQLILRDIFHLCFLNDQLIISVFCLAPNSSFMSILCQSEYYKLLTITTNQVFFLQAFYKVLSVECSIIAKNIIVDYKLTHRSFTDKVVQTKIKVKKEKITVFSNRKQLFYISFRFHNAFLPFLD